MHRNDIKPYLEWETRRHRDGGWIWPKAEEDGPGIWGWLFVAAMVVLLAVLGW